MKEKIKPTGKLGVLIVGLGACSTTFLAGINAIRKGSPAIGSLTQMGKLRPNRRDSNDFQEIRELVPLADLNEMEFLCWDVFSDDAYTAALKAKVLTPQDLEFHKLFLEDIKPKKAVFKQKFVKNLRGNHTKGGTALECTLALITEIEQFQKEKNIDNLVMIWCASTEAFWTVQHHNLDALHESIRKNEDIPPSQIYAYAALQLGIPVINGAPNAMIDSPAFLDLALANQAPIAGKDFKTGQTLVKTIMAPGLRSRLLGVKGWFSTNILGNRDGKVLDDPNSFKTKEVSKLSVLEQILDEKVYPELYENLYHKVRINYYPPHGDNKEGWDNIDIVGWMGYGMQIKINFLCKDSILAAPIILDLILFMDLAKRAGLSGIQEWLSFYFKSPQTRRDLEPIHSLFAQEMKLYNTIRYFADIEPIHYTGNEYYNF